jgi:endoribonuclease LACTB2
LSVSHRAGTNCYLVGKRSPYILIDTGEGKPEFIPFLKQALSSSSSSTSLISDIIITHKHRDHWGGVPSTLALLQQLLLNDDHHPPPPKLHAFPLQPNGADAHHVQLTEMLGSLKPGTEVARSNSTSNSTVHTLYDGQIIGPLQVIHTPGHTSDSISLYLQEEGALFTADTILGYGTAVFEDLSMYLTSLRRLLHTFEGGRGGPDDDGGFEPQHAWKLRVIYPGHGPAIEGTEKALNTIKSYIQHRLDREREFITILESENSIGPYRDEWTADEILAKIYPEHLRPMAKRGLLLHLTKLENEHRVVKISTSADGDASPPRWKVVNTVVE